MKRLYIYIAMTVVVVAIVIVAILCITLYTINFKNKNSVDRNYLMRVLNISNSEDERILREKSLLVSKSDEFLQDDIKRLINTLKNTLLYSAGLSAIQVGIKKKIVVINWLGASRKVPYVKFPLVMINPEIVWHSDESIYVFEGCLSVPYNYKKIKIKNRRNFFIKRYSRVKVRYFDEDFNERIIETGPKDQFFAECLQHEIDHLDGILYIDHLPEERREEIIRLNREYSNPTKGDDL